MDASQFVQQFTRQFTGQLAYLNHGVIDPFPDPDPDPDPTPGKWNTYNAKKCAKCTICIFHDYVKIV